MNNTRVNEGRNIGELIATIYMLTVLSDGRTSRSGSSTFMRSPPAIHRVLSRILLRLL